MPDTKAFPRILIASPGSGSGKTLITCALLQLLKRRGYTPASFKCGPDYIDPMFHRTVLGVPSRNLDIFLAGKTGVLNALATGSHGRDIGILEGVMGYFDGMTPTSADGSSYDIASKTGTPAILIINCKGMSRSVIALAKGFCEYDSNKTIKGIILNNLPGMLFKDISDEITLVSGVPVIGFMPPIKNLPLESRHLGLVMPDEIPGLIDVIDEVADVLEENIDFDAFIKIAREAEWISEYDEKARPNSFSENREGSDSIKDISSDAKVRIGIAKDEAFCFYYEDNLDLLSGMGAELVPFSPVHDEVIPEVDGLIIGGGYPELYAKALLDNESMRASVKRAADSRMPILAECGGFLYLKETLTDSEEMSYPMAGVFEGGSHMTDKLSHFGYVKVSAQTDNPYLKEGEQIRGHEFHYYDTDDNGDVCIMEKPSGKRSWRGYQLKDMTFGGFAHLYYPSCPEMAERFLDACAGYRAEKYR